MEVRLFTVKLLLWLILCLDFSLLPLCMALFVSIQDRLYHVMLVLVVLSIPVSVLFTLVQLAAIPLSRLTPTDRSILWSRIVRVVRPRLSRPWYLWACVCISGLTTGFNQRFCNGAEASSSWGIRECGMFRGVLGLSILMLVVEAAVLMVTDGRHHREQGDEVILHTSWASESTLGKTDAAHLPDREGERWLQRRNSLSSQRAIYPNQLPSSSRQSAYRPSTTTSLRTLPSASFELADRSSSSTSSSASTASRRYRQPPSCPPIPELPKSVENLPYLPVPPPPPPAWCPPLQHAPLSADPVIRSWATSMSDPTASPPIHPPSRPTIPHRAPGHMARPSTSRTQANAPTNARLLRRPPSIRHPNRQRLWTYTYTPTPTTHVPSNGMRPSMYSVSSYGTTTRGSVCTNGKM